MGVMVVCVFEHTRVIFVHMPCRCVTLDVPVSVGMMCIGGSVLGPRLRGYT